MGSVRTDLAVAEQALSQVEDEAEDARIRALVSETPVASREHESIRRQYEVQRRNRDRLVAALADLEKEQDKLLDAYNTNNGNR